MLQLVYAPDPVFRQKAVLVKEVNDSVRHLVDDMFNVLYAERGVGLGANMVGVLERIAIVDLQDSEDSEKYVFINPEITWRSDEMQTVNEASLSFPGISAEITRPSAINIKYIDYNGEAKELKADGFLAAVIQHEVEYLDGRTYLDHLSQMKRNMLLKKMKKYIKMYPPHVHTSACSH